MLIRKIASCLFKVTHYVVTPFSLVYQKRETTLKLLGWFC